MTVKSPLLRILAGKVTVDQLSPDECSLLLAEARSAGLLGRLAYALTDGAKVDLLPSQLKQPLLAATIQAKGFRRDVFRELGHIQKALSQLKVPVVLLKGASYVLMAVPSADGRIFSDVDLLVPKDAIGHAEAALMLGGWSVGTLDSYDQRYYRQWSHEIPPMTHLHRGTTLDLHHSLVMPTCRVRIDTGRMIGDARPVESNGFWWRLSDEDMVLHASCHLVLNSEFDRGLRDLWDIDLLYRHFASTTEGFSDRLVSRANQVGLATILGQVMRLVSKFFNTPLPTNLLKAKDGVFLSLISRAASTRHPQTRPWGQGAADMALIWREMHLRLPPRLLAIHLLHKTGDLFSSPKKVDA